MTERSAALQHFVEQSFIALHRVIAAPQAHRCIHQIFSALSVAGERRNSAGQRLPVCEQLETAYAVAVSDPYLAQLVVSFRAIESDLIWRRRADPAGTASANFEHGHANAMILGPGGLEERSDVWLGVSLLAPHVRYPDHDHAPEEVYLVLSPGEFLQGEGDWFSPGIGGSFYNTPGIRHAMRSGELPLFAFWWLREG